ncbi:MAG: RDD family protein [Bacilli bacterium]|nr:RDD family protein [Bacilli bacterium]
MADTTIEKTNLNHVEIVKPGRHLLGHLIDGLLVLILGFLLFQFAIFPNMQNTFGGKDAYVAAWRFEADSALLSIVDSKGVTINPYDGNNDFARASYLTFDTYEGYYNHIWDYYTVFLPTDERTDKLMVEVDGKKVEAPVAEYYKNFDMKVLNLPDPSTIIDPTNPAQLQGDSKYFRYALDSENKVDLTAKPVLVVDPTTDENKTQLLNYFFNTDSGTGLYLDALNHFNTQSYMAQKSSIFVSSSWYCLLIAFLPVQFVLIFVVPLILKRGRTIGKLIVGTSVIKSDGFNITWKERILRPLVVMAVTSPRIGILAYFLAFLGASQFGSIGMLMMMAYVLVCGISFMFCTMGKGHQSIHDKVLKTLVVTNKASYFFNNYEELKEYGSAHTDEFPEFYVKKIAVEEPIVQNEEHSEAGEDPSTEKYAGIDGEKEGDVLKNELGEKLTGADIDLHK